MKNIMKPVIASMILCLSSSLACAADLEAMKEQVKEKILICQIRAW